MKEPELPGAPGRSPPRTIDIVATAALPWQTGTAYVALFRAFHLALRGLDVALYIPWLPEIDQEVLFGGAFRFGSFAEQEEFVRSQLPAPRCPTLHLRPYPARYFASLGSILPSGPLAPRLRRCDWLILEEPEHLSWKHPFQRYHRVAGRVTGIVLTNYRFYVAQAAPWAPFVAWSVDRYDRWLIRRHCDDVVVLAQGICDVPGAVWFQSSGIRSSFFSTPKTDLAANRAYFIGKLIWEKGFRELVDLLAEAPVREMDVYGVGKDRDAIDAYARSKGVTFRFRGSSADPAEDLKAHKLFINTSRSEMFCTTTAEALGQGGFVILPDCASNDAFRPFRNALFYTTPQEFAACVERALRDTPADDPHIRSLTWEAATDRLLGHYARAGR